MKLLEALSPDIFIRAYHLLLVEDDPAVGTLLRHVLEQEGYSLEIVTTVPSAKTLLDKSLSDIDLVLLDINLPGGTGFEILQLVRERSTIPVIFLSGLKQGTNVERALLEHRILSPNPLIPRNCC
jgi:DNA-binding response OmpR family regulator